MRLLFYKGDLAWPRVSGHDVHGFNMMRAMIRLGARVGLVTLNPPSANAVSGLDLELATCLSDQTPSNGPAPPLRRLEERYRSYWGIDVDHIRAFGAAAERFRADAVVVTGLEVLPMLGAVGRGLRVWYAADELCLHHLTQVRPGEPSSWSNLKPAAVKGLYERAFRRRIDRVWVVTSADARAMRWIGGMSAVDIVPNGVDSEWYRPSANTEDPETAAFWGRLDFGPNVQALRWFCDRMWPEIRARHPTARFTIMGFGASEEITTLGRVPGISIRPDVADIRAEVGRHALVVLPFVSGAGIKNKLLEAAAMGKAIVCTQRCLLGLNGSPPLIVANKPTDWVAAVSELWRDDRRRRAVGLQLREWVVNCHGWDRPARTALETLARTPTVHGNGHLR